MPLGSPRSNATRARAVLGRRASAAFAAAGLTAGLAWGLTSIVSEAPLPRGSDVAEPVRVGPAGGSKHELEPIPPPRFGEPLCATESELPLFDVEGAASRPAEIDPLRAVTAVPAGLPVDGWFTRGYGWRDDPWTGEREFHRGVDIGADLGTEVRAAADAFVARVSNEPDYGHVIDLDHGNGFVTRYAHLSETFVQPGQPLERGQAIGASGTSGRSTGPHLHYEVFLDGRRVNPWRYLGRPTS